MFLRCLFSASVYAGIFLSSLLFLSSCANYKNIVYFKDIQDSIYKQPAILEIAAYEDPEIRTNDILQVSVQTLDPQTTALTGAQTTITHNVQGTSSTGAGGATVQGFLVDKEGNIELPLVGKIHVAGLTTSEARELIRSKAAVYYKEPVVNVRFANFYVSVLGEVNRPAQYTIPNEKATVLDALALAGDMTVYGRRENVLLIREQNGRKYAMRLNLNNSEAFQNPHFYLRQGDVIYVEPNKARAAANDVRTIRNITIITSAANVLILGLWRLGQN